MTKPPDLIQTFQAALAKHQQNQLPEAESLYRQVLQADPDHADALHLLGVLEHQKQQPAVALALLQRAIRLAPNQAGYHSNLGVVLRKLSRLKAALASYETAIKLDPNQTDAHYNRGIILSVLGRHAEARRCYKRVLAINPNYTDAWLNLAICCLKLGDFAKGWELYEWRWVSKAMGEMKRQEFAKPLWSGKEPIAGKIILLHAEQGLGDTLQFCRYAALVAGRGARVLLQVQPELKALLAQLPGVTGLYANGEPLPDFDYHCPLMSLPLALATRLDNVPAAPSYLAPDPERLRTWQVKLGVPKQPRIGLVWSGGPLHKNDAQRSIPLALLRPLWAQQGYEFFSLQKEIRVTDQADLEASPIRHFGNSLSDFSDTAALVACMDQVISVDTAVAHLAAALGKPTWLMLPFDPDWRWLLKRTDSPWYPSMRLFRQTRAGDWSEVLDRVQSALTASSDS